MQTHSKSYKLFFLSLFLNSICIGQSLDFQTIQSFFSLDSNLIQTKCAEKGFVLDSIKNGKFQTIYFFSHKDNKKIKASITKMAENDFRSTDPVKQDKFGGQFVQSLYIKSNKTISLGVFKMKKRFEYYLLTYFQNPKN